MKRDRRTFLLFIPIILYCDWLALVTTSLDLILCPDFSLQSIRWLLIEKLLKRLSFVVYACFVDVDRSNPVWFCYNKASIASVTRLLHQHYSSYHHGDQERSTGTTHECNRRPEWKLSVVGRNGDWRQPGVSRTIDIIRHDENLSISDEYAE